MSQCNAGPEGGQPVEGGCGWGVHYDDTTWLHKALGLYGIGRFLQHSQIHSKRFNIKTAANVSENLLKIVSWISMKVLACLQMITIKFAYVCLKKSWECANRSCLSAQYFCHFLFQPGWIPSADKPCKKNATFLPVKWLSFGLCQPNLVSPSEGFKMCLPSTLGRFPMLASLLGISMWHRNPSGTCSASAAATKGLSTQQSALDTQQRAPLVSK